MKPEAKVGILFVTTLVVVLGFAYFLGVINPFSSSKELIVNYQFAGGIEVGSPVRVMGVKVGKVKSIDFNPGNDVNLKITITVNNKAWKSVRKDSKYFINLAGIIGEKFLEITPGSANSDVLKSGTEVRGEDPPRIDQLISQSYSLAGKLLEIVNDNESSVVETITSINELTVNLASLLKQVNSTDKNFVKNLSVLTGNLAHFSSQLRTKEGKKTLTLLKDLIWRLKDLDGPAISKFLQKEGIKAKLF